MEDHLNSQTEISFIITGFGSFHGMNENPTTSIIHHLESEKKKGNLDHHIEFTRVITTSASSAKDEVNDIIQQIRKQSQKDVSPGKHWVIVHFGVNHMKGKKPAFQLEQNAYNEANFRIADEDGFQPKKEQIIPNGALKRTTDINARKVMAYLLNDFDVVLSGDAGRFVCNYTYYTTLSSIEETFGDVQVHCLFVHVPTFDVIPEDVQFAFSKRLLNAISDTILAKAKKK